jgi:Domain of unknown function (DUF1735)
MLLQKCAIFILAGTTICLQSFAQKYNFISYNAAAVASYNAANATTFEALPNTLFTIESTKIVIKAGYRIGRVKVKIKFDQFDLSKKYIQALAISDGKTPCDYFSESLIIFINKIDTRLTF